MKIKMLNFIFKILLVSFVLLVLFCLWIYINELACHYRFLYDLLGFREFDCIDCGENTDIIHGLLWFYGSITCSVLFLIIIVYILRKRRCML